MFGRPRGSSRLWHLVCLLVAVALAARPCIADDWTPYQEFEDLVAWISARNAILDGFTMHQDCPSCLRGVVATKNIEEGDTIMRIPYTAVLQLRDYNRNTFAAEHARDVLESMHKEPSFNQTWGPFLATLPGPDSLLAPELWPDELLSKMETPELEEVLRHQRQITEEVYSGTYQEIKYTPFNEIVPESVVSLDTFKWVSALIGSRWWDSKLLGSHLVPVMDLLNHDDFPNALRSEEEGHVVLRAVRPIQRGESITINYLSSYIHRPDMSLSLYGFVIPRGDPLLASVDLPTFDPENPLLPTASDDSMYETLDSGYVTWEEYNRLAERLASFTTTEEEDQLLLDSGTITDWREEAVVQYRLLRKQALQNTMNRISVQLEAPSFEDAEELTEAGVLDLMYEHEFLVTEDTDADMGADKAAQQMWAEDEVQQQQAQQEGEVAAWEQAQQMWAVEDSMQLEHDGQTEWVQAEAEGGDAQPYQQAGVAAGVDGQQAAREQAHQAWAEEDSQPSAEGGQEGVCMGQQQQGQEQEQLRASPTHHLSYWVLAAVAAFNTVAALVLGGVVLRMSRAMDEMAASLRAVQHTASAGKVKKINAVADCRGPPVKPVHGD